METFDFSHYGDVKRSIRYLDRTIDFESGAFQVQKVGVNPITSFEFTYQGSETKLREIEDFYNRHRKSEKFTLPYNGMNYTCQFTSDYNPTDTWGFDSLGKIIAKVSVTLSMRVCNI